MVGLGHGIRHIARNREEHTVNANTNTRDNTRTRTARQNTLTRRRVRALKAGSPVTRSGRVRAA